MKKLCIAFILFIGLGYAQEAKPTQVYSESNITNLQCVRIFVDLVRSSDFGFENWGGDKGAEWVKENISFWFNTWDEHTIVARLLFDWQDSDSNEIRGAVAIGSVKYDRKMQTLEDNNLEKPLRFDKSLAKKLESCK